MLSRNEAERLAGAVNQLRPDWPVSSLMAFLKKREGRPLLDLSLQLVWVALDPETKTPARIDADGPWKRAAHVASVAAPVRTITDDDCAICLQPKSAAHADHEWEPQHARTHSVGMSDQQRQTIHAAMTAAEIERTTLPPLTKGTK